MSKLFWVVLVIYFVMRKTLFNDFFACYTLLEKMKRILRHSWLTDGRQESVAEHTWMMCMMAMMLQDKVSLQIDMERVLKMIVIHDLVEIYAGDMWAFDVADILNKKEKEKLENEAILRIEKEFSEW